MHNKYFKRTLKIVISIAIITIPNLMFDLHQIPHYLFYEREKSYRYIIF